MNEAQRQRPLEIINRIGRAVEQEWDNRDRGYCLRKPGAARFGFVRFNIGGKNARKYAIYAYKPFPDPRELFVDPSTDKKGQEGKYFVDPGDEDANGYAVIVLESAWDGK